MSATEDELSGQTAICAMCEPNETIALEHLLSHLWFTHGMKPEEWPDGEPVVEDTTLEPDDFA